VPYVQSLTLSGTYFYICVLTLLKIVKCMLDTLVCKFFSHLLLLFTLFFVLEQTVGKIVSFTTVPSSLMLRKKIEDGR